MVMDLRQRHTETFEHTPALLPTPNGMRGVSRRNFLLVGGLSMLGLGTLPKSILADSREKMKSLVIVVQGGAQSPYEFTSPLVDSATEYRGEVGHICGSNGMPIGENWKGFATIANSTAVIRALDTQNASHDARKFFPPTEMPKAGETLARGGIPWIFNQVRPSSYSDLAQIDAKQAFNIGYDEKVGRCVKPPLFKDPNLDEKAKLLEGFDTAPSTSRGMKMMQKNRELALSLLLGGGSIDEPFDKSESEREMKRYGTCSVGRGLSLASQFAQSGAGITMVYSEPGRGWDMHDKIKDRTAELAPITDKAITALIEDAHRHGFVVLITTEHGRTPKINGSGGRDHFNVGFMIGAGGGFGKGKVSASMKRDGTINEKDGMFKAEQVLPTTLAACGVHIPAPNNVIKEVLA